MSAAAQPIEDQPDPIPSGTEIQLGDLEKLRTMGMEFATELHRVAMARAPEAADSPLAQDRNLALSFTRVSRAVRQIIVLEQELMGLRTPPIRHAANGNVRSGASSGDADRDGAEGSDLNDLDDYNDLHEPSDYQADQYAVGIRIATEMVRTAHTPPNQLPWYGFTLEQAMAAAETNGIPWEPLPPDAVRPRGLASPACTIAGALTGAPGPIGPYSPEAAKFNDEERAFFFGPKYGRPPAAPARRRGRGPP